MSGFDDVFISGDRLKNVQLVGDLASTADAMLLSYNNRYGCDVM